jgi:alkanesulfonate monooxygenase
MSCLDVDEPVGNLRAQGKQTHAQGPQCRPQAALIVVQGYIAGRTTGKPEKNHDDRAARQQAFEFEAGTADLPHDERWNGVSDPDEPQAVGALDEQAALIDVDLEIGSALLCLTRHLRFLVAVRPGLISPILATRINASLDRISHGRANLNVVSGSGKFDFEGLPLSHEQRYELTREWLAVFRAAFGSDPVNFKGGHIHVENGNALLPSVQRPYPPIYFGGSSDEARAVAAEHADVYLSWGERPEEVREKFADVRRQAEARGRRLRFGLRAHIIVLETEEEAWREADRLIAHLTDEQIAKAQAGFAASESVGQQRMARLHHGSRDSLRIGRNLWAGVGLVRGGAGTAFVGSPENIARALSEYRDAGVETFILSGYPHLEEAYRTAELMFPAIAKASPIFQTAQQAVETATARAGSPTIGRFSSI